MKRFLRGFARYLMLFLFVAFMVSCCVSLFSIRLLESLNVTLSDADLQIAARQTLLNVIILSLMFTALDGLRRKLTMERSVRHITEAAKKIVSGDFSVRVQPISKFGADESFNEIIDCFNQMAQELSGVETLRTDFISNVSHEMKTPLAAMHNCGTLLQAPVLSDEERIGYAKDITDSSRKLADMMTNILKLNKLENQTIYPKAEEYDLGEQLQEAILQYEPVWDQKEIEIEADIADDVTIRADRELLSLVWNNLLSNAFKFTPEGGTVTLSLETAESYAIVKVRDTGCGMSPETGAHIFEKFYQGDTSHATQGNGLGLALVKRVMDIMHGEISVESAIGKGTTFTVKLRR